MWGQIPNSYVTLGGLWAILNYSLSASNCIAELKELNKIMSVQKLNKLYSILQSNLVFK